MTQTLYVFDMDDTLIEGDCSMIWNEYLVEQGIVTEPGFLQRDRELMALYSEGKMSMEAYLSATLQPLQSVSLEQLSLWVEACVTEQILPRVYPEAQALIETLKQQKSRMLVISASASFLIEPVARALGIPEALGINLKEDAGRITSQIEGIASYREGKVKRLEQWLAQQGIDRQQLEIHFYTDSINDLPLCLYADYAHLINPCPLLIQAADHRWQHYHW